MSTAFGLTSGFLCHFWYKYLDRILPGRGIKIVVTKIAWDQILFSPVSTTFLDLLASIDCVIVQVTLLALEILLSYLILKSAHPDTKELNQEIMKVAIMKKRKKEEEELASHQRIEVQSKQREDEMNEQMKIEKKEEEERNCEKRMEREKNVDKIKHDQTMDDTSKPHTVRELQRKLASVTASQSHIYKISNWIRENYQQSSYSILPII